MTNESTPNIAGKGFNNYAYPSSAYFLTVSVLYLWGYWSPFDINILEYLSLTDIIKVTIYPIASAFIFVAAGAIAGSVSPSSKAKFTGEFSGRIVSFVGNYPLLTIQLYLLLVLLAFIFTPQPTKQALIPAMLAIPVAIYASHHNFLSQLIPGQNPRSTCIFLLACLPFFAFSSGYTKANDILEGRKYDYAFFPIEGLKTQPTTTPDKMPRFLGRAGDHLFFWDPQLSIVIISKLKEDKPLALKHVKPKKQNQLF